VLGANYPGTDWYEHAFKLMQSNQDKVQAAQAATKPAS
jgi:outer membrane protein assembly factor BamD